MGNIKYVLIKNKLAEIPSEDGKINTYDLHGEYKVLNETPETYIIRFNSRQSYEIHKDECRPLNNTQMLLRFFTQLPLIVLFIGLGFVVLFSSTLGDLLLSYTEFLHPVLRVIIFIIVSIIPALTVVSGAY